MLNSINNTSCSYLVLTLTEMLRMWIDYVEIYMKNRIKKTKIKILYNNFSMLGLL